MAKTRRKQQPQRSAQRATAGPAATERANAAPAAPRPAADPRAAERITRQQERAAARRRLERQRQIRQALIGLVALALVVGGLAWVISRGAFAEAPGRSVPIVGWEHIDADKKGADHNSAPPTSGQHHTTTANAGVHTAPIPDEMQIHNLEHGQIMVQYTCTDCPDLAERLKGFAARYPKWVLVAPYPDPRVGARIALTAWGRIDTFDEYDEARIQRFIEYYKNKGRERVIAE